MRIGAAMFLKFIAVGQRLHSISLRFTQGRRTQIYILTKILFSFRTQVY